MVNSKLRLKHYYKEEKRSVIHTLKKNSIVVKIVAVAVLVMILFTVLSFMQAPKKTINQPKACFKHDTCLDLIVTKTPVERIVGLTNYSSLLKDEGMLFIFEKADIQRMWMNGTNFPMDIIWVSVDFRVLHIEKNVLPCIDPMCDIFAPVVRAKYVIETNSGFTDRINLYDYDKVTLIDVK